MKLNWILNNNNNNDDDNVIIIITNSNNSELPEFLGNKDDSNDERRIY